MTQSAVWGLISVIVPVCKANEVYDADLYVADNESDAQNTLFISVSVCDCNSYWFRVRWKAGESSPWPPDARDNPFDVEIWVPIAKLNWGWNGIAESTDGGITWSKTSGSHDTPDPGGSVTTEFPVWPDTQSSAYPPWVPD